VISGGFGAVRAPVVPGAVAPEDAERRHAHLRQQQLRMLCHQATRSPFAVIVAIVFVAIVVWDAVPAWKVIAWAAVLVVFPIGRGIYSSRVLRNNPAEADPGLRFHVASTFTGGIVVGLAAPLFFNELSDERRAFLTMVLVCWSAAGVSAMAAYARVYYAYVAPIMLQVAGAWTLVDFGAQSSLHTEERMLAGALILFAGAIQSFFARDGERVLRESFQIRYENERLIGELERERQEVVLARDRAEAANRAKSRFLAAASHDLRQPLHALSLFSAALQVRAPDGDIGEIGRNINAAALSLSALVESLLDISKLDAGAVKVEKRRVGVRRVLERIDSAFRSSAEAKGLELRMKPMDADLTTDPVILERILRNLVDNAIKYTSSGSVTVSADAIGPHIAIAVRDTGPGIPADEHERIFEEFYQIGNPERDRAQGLGLGLAIVRRLARLLDSQVQLVSTVGRGTEFSIRFPRAAREADAAAAGDSLGAGADDILQRASALVIDDEPAVRHGMRTLLEAWGCRVTVASGRAEAEQLLERYKLTVDVIVADFRLRQHENGIETVRRLRERIGEPVPALLISGDTAAERLREAQESGLPLLHKPVAPDKLREALLNALSR
jgi:signal transduction histidine kinase/CheY-like chemotaxis protein